MFHTLRSQRDPDGRQLSVDPAVAPGRILPGQSDHQLHRAGWDFRSAGGLQVRPLPPDQITMSAQQGVGLDEEEEAMELHSGE
jgi:hypothetical protein